MTTYPGSHLAAPGAYQETIAKLINKYPNLANADYKPWRQPRELSSPARLVVFEFAASATSGTAPTRKDFAGIDELKVFLDTDAAGIASTNPIHRFWILEGLHPAYIAVLGDALDVDPRLWMRHQRVNIRERPYREAGSLPVLPTLASEQQGFTFSYCQLVHLNYEPQTFTARCAENERHIALTRLVDREQRGHKFDGVGVVHRKVSTWFQNLPNDGWNTLVVVDEAVKRILAGDQKKNSIIPTLQAPTPFQGGYQDFLPFSTIQEAKQTPGPPRSSIYDDLCYYVQYHHNVLDLSADSRSSTLFVHKIVASESALLAQYMNGVLSTIAWQLSRLNELRGFRSDWIEQRWSDLMGIQRRIGGYRDDVMWTISSLEAPNVPQGLSSWKNCVTDFQWIEARLLRLHEDARSLVEAFSGLAGIAGNQQALSEARNISYLNILGTTFVPLSLIASILSLPRPYTPGAPEAWKYWAIAVPLVIAVYAVWFMLTLTLKKGTVSPLASLLVNPIRCIAHSRRWSGGRRPSTYSASSSAASKPLA